VIKAWIDEFEDDRSVIYLLDDNLRIAYCNKAWDEFAERNGGVKLQRTEQVGRRVLDSTEEPLKAFYRSAFERALAEHQAWEHLYECSSPGLYREFHMQVLPVQSPPCLVVVNSLVVEKPHERVIRPPLTALYRTSGGVITMCMHCRRTRGASSQFTAHARPGLGRAAAPSPKSGTGSRISWHHRPMASVTGSVLPAFFTTIRL